MKYFLILLLAVASCTPNVRRPPVQPAQSPPVAAVSPQPALAAPEPMVEVAPPQRVGKPGIRREKEIVRYPYGEGRVTVRCKELRVCDIELGQGETIGDVIIGDQERWQALGSHSGSGDHKTPHVVVKPHFPGIKTNLIVTTDRRVYDVDLVEGGKADIRVGFWFPEEEYQQEQQRYEAQRRKQKAKEAQIAQPPPVRNERYAVNGDFYFTPTKVADDGVRTYLELPEAAKTNQLPILYNTSGGKMELMNVTYQDNTIVVGQLFDEAALVLGTGRQQQKVVIRRVQ